MFVFGCCDYCLVAGGLFVCCFSNCLLFGCTSFVWLLFVGIGVCFCVSVVIVLWILIVSCC